MKELERYREAVRHLPEGCLEAEAQAEKQEKLSVELSGGVPGTMSCSEQTELFVRASAEKTGMVYTQKLDDDPYAVICQALKNSEISQSQEREPMATREMWEQLGIDPQSMGSLSGQLRLVEISELIAFARRLEQEMSPVKLRIGVSQTILTMGLVNSTGLDVSAATGRFEVEVSSEDGYGGFYSAGRLEEIDAAYFVKGMKDRKLTKQPRIPSRAGSYRAVLSSGVVNNILITAWQMFTARRAQTGGTPFAGKMGEMIFSPCISIADRKIDSGNGYTWKLDCEGIPCQDTVLVENGVLKGWMHNLSTAKNDGVLSTGNAGRKTLLSGNIHTDMLIMPTNFVMKEGEASLEELIAACGDGIYIYENYDQFHALNVVSGDFTFPCKGIEIRDGKLAGVMEGLTMNGNVCQLFAGVELLGKDRVVDPLVMYSSYTVSGPAMLVKDLRISG